MKKCLVCDREYPETSEVCEADGGELISVDYIFDAPTVTSETIEAANETIVQKVEDGENRAPVVREAELAALERAKLNQLGTKESEVEITDPTRGFKQWHAALAALLLMTIGFGGFYLYGRHNEQTAQINESPPLTSDPNAKPLKSIALPNGEAEKDISLNAPVSTPDAQATNAQTGATDTTKAKDGLTSPIKTTGEVYDTNAPTDSPFIPPPDNTKVYKTNNATGTALVSEASSGAKGEKNKNAKNSNETSNANSNVKNRNAPRNANAKEDANRNAAAPRPTPKPSTQPPTEKRSAPAAGKTDEKKPVPPRE